MKLFFNIFFLSLFFNIGYSQSNAKEQAVNYTEFKGKVINSESKEPLPFANLSLIGTNITSITNSSGEFIIKIPKTELSSKVRISFLVIKLKLLSWTVLKKKIKPFC